MTVQHETRVPRELPAEMSANPPPQTGYGPPLFQGMQELRVRHGESPWGMDRMLRMTAGLLVGAAFFGALYAAILFLG